MLSAVARSPGPDIRSLTLIRCAPNEAAPAAGGRGGRRKASVFGAGAAPRGYPQGRGSYGGRVDHKRDRPALVDEDKVIDQGHNDDARSRCQRATARSRTSGETADLRRSTGPAPSRWSNTPRLPARRAAARPWTRGGERLSWVTRRRTSS